MRIKPVLALAALAVPAVASACLWDHDTLKQERSRFPSTLELVTGKFLRHSPEFYQWRVKDRLAKLELDPSNPGLHDDLAVAYQKTGEHARAVETMLAKEKIAPGLYETYSNLGTFYVLAGDFERGLPYIDKALAINPDAHFGRERYQKWLVEYAMSKRRDGKLEFPLVDSPEKLIKVPGGDSGFTAALASRLRKDRHQLTQEDRQKAVKGVLGMMRFADHDNPLLLEALGDLLVASNEQPEDDAKQLAARAYLAASYKMKDEAARLAYRKRAEQALFMQTRPRSYDQLPLADLEADFKAELIEANRWYAKLKESELAWVRDGKDADAEFDALYTAEPAALDMSNDPLLPWSVVIGSRVAVLLAVPILGVFVAWWIWRRVIRA